MALPPKAFELSVWSIGTVVVDPDLKVAKALYSVPWRLIGQRLHARTAGDVVQIFAGTDVVATRFVGPPNQGPPSRSRIRHLDGKRVSAVSVAIPEACRSGSRRPPSRMATYNHRLCGVRSAQGVMRTAPAVSPRRCVSK